MPQPDGSKHVAVRTEPGRLAAADVLRFGMFEVDVSGEELRRNGLKVVLPHQPFQILARLIEHPGDIVTREELRRSLWAESTHVDFDHCLNTAVNKLREVLNDSAENPRFVETVPRKGYRFVAPVSHGAPASRAPRREEADAPEIKSPPPVVLAEVQRRRSNLFLMAMTAAAVLVLALVTWLALRNRPQTVLLPEAVAFTRFHGSEVTPSISPDGQQVAFSWNSEPGKNFNLYGKPLHGGEPRRLTESASHDFGPAYSPDGQHIAFYRRSGDGAGLYSVPPTGGAARRLAGLEFGPPDPLTALSGTTTDLPLQSVSWSPDGNYVAFVDRVSLGAPFSVFVWSTEGRHRVRLTWPPEKSLGDGSPVFSPRGQRLAFVRYADAFSGDVYVVSLAGGNPTRLTSDNRGIRGVACTPDGGYIVFSSDREGQTGLWRVRATGGAPERVSGVSESAMFPIVLAHGKALLYTRWSHDDDIWRVPLAPSPQGSASAIKLVSVTGDNEHPRYSPDGRRIVFTSGASGNRAIWVCDDSGKNPVRLTPADSYSSSPQWSPDGRHIAFDARPEGNWEVYVVAAEGGAPRRLVAHPAEDSRPSWSSDGRWMYFRSDRSGTNQIWKVPANGGEAVQMTRNGAYEVVESADGRVLYYTRRGVPGLFSIPVEGGAETLVMKDLEANSRDWVAAREGVYVVTGDGETSRRPSVVEFFRFRTGRLEPVAHLGTIRPGAKGFSISPDGRWLVFSGRDEMETDLALLQY